MSRSFDPPPRRHLLRSDAAILAVIEAAGPGAHLTAAAIYLRARESEPAIGLATVHRSLSRLSEAGAILRIALPDGEAAFFEMPNAPHAHFVCRTCHAMRDIPMPDLSAMLQNLAGTLGADVDTASLTLHGSCRTCSREKTPAVRN